MGSQWRSSFFSPAPDPLLRSPNSDAVDDWATFNEYVIFNAKQVCLRYAVLVKTAGYKTLTEAQLQAMA